MGGGGGGGGSSFSAQGSPPGFDYSTAMGLQQLAIGGDIQSYALSDQDFANRYPGLQDAYNQWQANLGQQVGQTATGAAGQGQIMGGLGSQILGRQGTQTTGDINAVRNAAATAAGAAQPIMGLASRQAGLAQPLVNLGQQQAGLAQPLIGLGQQQAGLAPGLINMGGQMAGLGRQQAGLAPGLVGLGGAIAGLGGRQAGIGGGINQMGGQLAGAAQIPYQMGQQLLQEPIDPQTQQQMMRAGLSSAAGALGAASLGQGMAGQAAAARQLGLNTLQYGQAMRGEAMGDINQYASMLGAAGQMRGLGAQTIGAGGQTAALGGQTVGLGGQQLAQGAQGIGAGAQTVGLGGQQLTQGGALIGAGGQQLTQGGALMGLGGQQLAGAGGLYGQGAQTAATAGGLSGAAQGLQEAYGMNTAQMAGMYGQLQNQQAAQQLGAIGTAGQLFQKRPFGLGGSNMAQSELGQTGAYNSFQQANYATMNGIAFNQAQMQAQQQQLGAQQSAGMMSAGVGAVGAAASAASAAAMSCWVARVCFGDKDSRWKQFRLWLLNYAPRTVRRLYLVHGQAFAKKLSKHPLLRAAVRSLMEAILKTQRSRRSLLTLNNLLCA